MTEVSTREAQRRRTRRAIVDAAAELLATGVTPSVGDIAERADVSRRTVYQYFPTLEQLLLDATLGALTQAAVDDAILATDLPSDAGARVERLARALAQRSRDTLPLGHTLIRLTVEGGPAAVDDTGGGAAPPRRGYRRV